MGKGQQAAHPPEPGLQHLGVAGTLRRAVVEDDHPLGQRHGAGRPGEDRPVADQLEQLEQPQAVEQHGDMAAGQGEGLAAGEDLGQLVAMAPDRGAAARPHLAAEAAVELAHRVEVAGIELTDRLDRLGAGACSSSTEPSDSSSSSRAAAMAWRRRRP